MFLKREKKDDCIISGYVVGDEKHKEYSGKSYVEFGISMGKDETTGENLPIINISVWERQIPEIKKGDRVLATGKLRATEKDGKIYYSLSADFCIKEILDSAPILTDKLPNLEPIDDESLPF